MTICYDTGNGGENLAYVYSPPERADDARPVVMFCGGFKSDMTGTKATWFEAQCCRRGQGYIRFDYSGHGASGGAFEDGTIGRWAEDALNILDRVTQGPVVLVGSSMGGWVALLLLLQRPERIRGVLGIAAAPDFTLGIEAHMSATQKDILNKTGRIETQSEYGGEPYVFTKALLEDGRAQSLLDRRYDIDVPLTLVQGKRDEAVPWQTAHRIEKAFPGPATRAIFVEDGDHRLSREQDLILMDAELVKLTGA